MIQQKNVKKQVDYKPRVQMITIKIMPECATDFLSFDESAIDLKQAKQRYSLVRSGLGQEQYP